MYSVTTSGLIFTWDPPELSHRNGNITGYILNCRPTNTTLYTSHTNFTMAVYALDSSYNCSLSAINSMGTGPASTLVFTLSDPVVDGVSERNDCNSVTYYIVGPVIVVIVGLIVIIVALGIAICHYKRKIER